LNTDRAIQLAKNKGSYGITFSAMASPCEVIIQSTDKQLAAKVGDIIATEVWRIEDKYSRYNQRSVCSAINNNAGHSVAIDEETYLLLNFAEQCYQLSDGLFDISSGVLRKVWSFQGEDGDIDNFPTAEQVNQKLAHVGWRKVHFDQNQISLVKGMEIDFGGIGKEYAVDRAIILAKQLTNSPILVNLGGDLAVTCSRLNNEPWQVAIEHPDADNNHTSLTDMIVSLKSGALATSGDARRFLINEGKRYSHILNAKTGWPINEAPRSITVVAPQCIQAGILATLALLQGNQAEQFLEEQEIKFWSRR
jgi:thiamine biosynthesis lipoprotein|tara:strand:- start:11501 stop:12421 length:921 start_codon:yes stop_codon:yes gene_type:complete